MMISHKLFEMLCNYSLHAYAAYRRAMTKSTCAACRADKAVIGVDSGCTASQSSLKVG